jgi:uncharacterized protein (TIGR02996 family)
MSDGPALRAAICANPDDDTARLVYADWLEENNSPGTAGRAGSSGGAGSGTSAKRAQFIRAKVEEARLDAADTAARDLSWLVRFELGGGAGRIDWRAVDAELGAHVADAERYSALVSPLTYESEGVPRIAGVDYWGWGRGFYQHLHVANATALLKHTGELFRAAPIDSARFERLTAAQARELVRSGHLVRFRELSFGESVEPEAVRVFGAHADATGVRQIAVDFAKHLEPLAAGKHWTGVRTLLLRGLKPRGAARGVYAELFARPWCRGLRTVEANQSGLDSKAAQALARHCPELRVLNLAHNPIDDDGASALARSKSLKRLRVLNLTDSRIESDTCGALIAGAHLPALTVLGLAGCGSGPSAKALAQGTRAPTLRALVLSYTDVGPVAGALAAHPALAELLVLDLRGANLRDDGAEALFRAPVFERLAYLDLGANEIGPRGARALAAWPGAANLQWLNLLGNPLGDAGCKALAAGTNFKNLKALSAEGRGTIHLKKRFKKAMVDDE